MQVQHEQFQDREAEERNLEKIAALQHQVEELQAQIEKLQSENTFIKGQLERKEEFTAMVAHELRGPLTPIISYSQMIARPNQRTEAIQRGARIIESQAIRLTRYVNDLLDASHLSKDQFTLRRERCDIATLAREIVEQTRPIAPRHQLRVETPETPVYGNWDGGRLIQALGNLLDNAIKYSDEHTTVTVRVWVAENKACVSVHNQGASIPSEGVERLFHPYVRLAATNHKQGSGLGLYISKCIIEAHQGTLRLEPHKGEEQGTTFTFCLPMDVLASSNSGQYI